MNKVWDKLVRLHRWCNKREWLLIILLIVILARIPTLVTPHYYGDEEIYFVMGRAWRMGVPLYQAMFDHKPPLIYIIAGIFPTIALFRGFLLASMLLHTYLFWKLANLFWGSKHPNLAKLSSLIFVVLSTIPTFEGNIVNAELLMMLPVTASLLLIWQKNNQKEHPLKTYFIAGLVAGIGWLYKIPVAFDVAAIGLYWLVLLRKSWRESIKAFLGARLWLYAVGFALPLLLSFVYYYLKGSGPDYLSTVLTVNLGYVSSWKSDSFTRFNPLKSGLLLRALILILYTWFLYLVRKKIDKRLLLAGLWSGFSLFGALLSYRPYPHYLQEVAPAISLLVPTLFTTQTLVGWLIWAVLIAVGIMTQNDVKFWAYESRPLYLNYWQLITKKISKDEYISRFDNAKRNYELSDYIAKRIGVDDHIFVWGSDPTVYNLTNKLPSGGKYIVNFHIHDLNKYDYVMQNLNKNEPKAIVILPESGDFPALYTMIAVDYVEVYQTAGASVYWRIK